MLTDDQISRLEDRGANVVIRERRGVGRDYSISWPVAHTSSGAAVFKLGANTLGFFEPFEAQP